MTNKGDQRRLPPDVLAKSPGVTLEPVGAFAVPSAAIRGASQAFSPQRVPVKVQPVSAVSHGAKAAAAAADLNSRPVPVLRPSTTKGGHVQSAVQADLNRLDRSPAGTSTLNIESSPESLIPRVAKSPSSIAAQVATSTPIIKQASPLLKDFAATNDPRRLAGSEDDSTPPSLTPDVVLKKTKTIMSANSASFIDMSNPALSSVKQSRTTMKSQTTKEEVNRDYPGMRAPQPIRPTATKPVLATILALEQLSIPESRTASALSQPSPPKASAGMMAARAAAKSAAPTAPSPAPKKATASPAIDIPSSKPPLPSPRRERSPSRVSEVETDVSSSWTSESRTSFKRTDTNASSVPGDLARTSSSNHVSPRRPDLKPGMMSQALTDAIAASSLASSRAYSPPKQAPRPPARRSKSHSLFGHHHNVPDLNVTENVTRGLRHTLRKHSSDNEDEGVVKRGRHHFMRKHPNKHHEGDRKRWRDGITERERKRYEGVWAANKGLFTFWQTPDADFGSPIQAAPEKDLVLNLVVREIWERSHLPKDVLEQIWDLVDYRGSNTLSRHEFVVGLWLIDQSLKGRKLPVKVSPSVWASVRHTHGVKILRHPL